MIFPQPLYAAIELMFLMILNVLPFYISWEQSLLFTFSVGNIDVL